MFEKLGIFSMAEALAKHGAERQAVIAENIANADTPGYKASDLASFAETYQANDPNALRATRPGHFLEGDAAGYNPEARKVYRPGAESPNGNTVTLEQEIFAAAEAKQEHDVALSVYGAALDILRTSLGGRN